MFELRALSGFIIFLGIIIVQLLCNYCKEITGKKIDLIILFLHFNDFSIGDDRVNLSPALSAMYTLFVREHNRIADKLRCVNPQWLPEFVFQEARKIIAALIQQITYTEYLPVILGKEDMWRYGLTINSDGYDYSVYNPNVNAGIANSFASAAIKFIHTQIPSMLGFFDNETVYVNLEETFHRPWYAQQNGGRGMEEIMEWLVNDAQPETNRSFSFVISALQ